jgi:GDP-L-fucose synthase
MYVDDLADACYFLMQEYNEALFINIGSGEEISILQLAQKVKDVTAFDGEIRFDSTKPDGTPRKLMDSTRLHNLGWKHQTSFEEGLQKTYTFYKQEVSST